MPDENVLSLTDVEWRLMQSLWKLGSPSLSEIVADVKDVGWTKHAVISFLKRMEAKGAVKIEGERPKKYSALLEKSATLRKETHSILNRIYGGDLMLMVTNAVDSTELSDEEVSELISILQKGR